MKITIRYKGTSLVLRTENTTTHRAFCRVYPAFNLIIVLLKPDPKFSMDLSEGLMRSLLYRKRFLPSTILTLLCYVADGAACSHALSNRGRVRVRVRVRARVRARVTFTDRVQVQGYAQVYR